MYYFLERERERESSLKYNNDRILNFLNVHPRPSCCPKANPLNTQFTPKIRFAYAIIFSQPQLSIKYPIYPLNQVCLWSMSTTISTRSTVHISPSSNQNIKPFLSHSPKNTVLSSVQPSAIIKPNNAQLITGSDQPTYCLNFLDRSMACTKLYLGPQSSVVGFKIMLPVIDQLCAREFCLTAWIQFRRLKEVQLSG